MPRIDRLTAPLRGAVSALLLCLTTLFWGVPLCLLAAAKPLALSPALQRAVTHGLDEIAQRWLSTNLIWMRWWLNPRIEATIPAGVSIDAWWLVISNHRSWTDIFVLQHALCRRLSPPRFLVKRELRWLPIVGLAFWAMEFPLLRRSRDASERDLRQMQRMCELARRSPTTFYVFAEGTRFTRAKHDAQRSPHAHLLRPRAGGCAQVAALLGDRLAGVLDATLVYRTRQGEPLRLGFWDFLCGRTPPIELHIQQRALPEWTRHGDYLNDEHYRKRFQAWINSLWQEKDHLLASRSGISGIG
ncbi:acetyltransferase [Halotalea alkalilenta]|uniref:acetyltransferase n=1 Tax=Halotalea alkalilenta TaxID=376489 RepID=UPI000480B32F|nr:acetyltransferase [Halotalea alkalilenta]